MTTIDKYLQHARQSQLVKKHATSIFEKPVCPKCERIGFRDKGWKTRLVMTCPFCGYNGVSTKIVKAYLEEELYL